ncbi:major capsid protein [Nocardioides aurantiacus]|uniref:Major capsid protein E n=1 Tax=Nocardioides aurantiacus TaxID=86796 RepID=A0A3N2CX19_9ACTN|nr:major capsid protein [Nocardioides aurantiacus]ROR91764.1 major capsid protein E [Nocardioides aurantiacus]
MAIVFDGPVTPDALTTFVREVPSPADQVLNTILPDRVLNRNTVDLSELTRTNRTARFRAFDARLHVSERDTVATKQVKLPPLSSSVSVGEFERLQLEFARLGGTNQAAIVDAIYDDATNLTREVRARMEQARGDVLTDGKFTLAGEGNLTMEADFGVPANHIVAPATLWSNVASATIIANLTDWVNVYVATNGSRPTGMIVSTRAMNYMLQNAEIRSLAASLAGAPGLVTRPALDAALAAFGLPPVSLVYDSNVDVDGVSTKVIPDDRVILFGENVGYTAWGITATALELVGAAETDLSFADAPGIVGVVIKEGPPFRQFSYVDAVGMPVLENPRRLLIADVA